MIEKYLSRQEAEDIFYSAMITGIMSEKQAECLCDDMEKSAQVLDTLKRIGGVLGAGVTNIGGAVKEIVKESPSALAYLALTGAGAGALGATAYDMLKENVTNVDPQEKLNAKLEALYRVKKKELESSNWMSRVRTMRDDLKRNYKKMSTEEYAKAYKALEDALDERRA